VSGPVGLILAVFVVLGAVDAAKLSLTMAANGWSTAEGELLVKVVLMLGWVSHCLLCCSLSNGPGIWLRH
jgi:hypothetical protein